MAGHTPRAGGTITTTEQLDSLPLRSVVLDRDGDPWQCTAQGEPNLWTSTVRSVNTEDVRSELVARILGPITVLHVPSEPPPLTRAIYDCGCGFTIVDDTGDADGFEIAVEEHEETCDPEEAEQ